MVLWAICYPLITAGLEFSPHITFAALRALLAGLALVGLALVFRQSVPTDFRTWMILAVIGFGATTLAFLGMFHAAEFVSPGIATVIANTQPLLAAVLAGIVLSEKLTSDGIVGLAMGFAGILFIALPQILTDARDSYVLGVAYIVLAAIGITVSNVLLKWIAGSVEALMAMGLQILLGSIPLVLVAWIMEDPTEIRWSSTFLASLISLSLLGTALVYWLWFSILETVPLSRANTFSFLIPIFGLTMGILFYDETLGALQLIGIALSIVGVVLVTRPDASQQTAQCNVAD